MLSSETLASLGTAGLILLLVITITGAIVAFVFFLMRELKYNRHAIVYSSEEGVLKRMFKYKCRKIYNKKDKSTKVQVKKYRTKPDYPSEDFWFPYAKSLACFFFTDGKTLTPVKASANSPLTINAEGFGVSTDMNQLINSADERHGGLGFWEKYGGAAMFISGMVFILIAIIFLISELGQGIEVSVSGQIDKQVLTSIISGGLIRRFIKE